MSIKNIVGLSFEEDVMYHNQLLEKTSITIDKRIASTYDMESSMKAIKAIASLIETKANKQKSILDSAIMNMSSCVEIEK